MATLCMRPKRAFLLIIYALVAPVMVYSWNIRSGDLEGSPAGCISDVEKLSIEEYPMSKEMLESFGKGIGDMGDYMRCVELPQPVNYCYLGPEPQAGIGLCLPPNCTSSALIADTGPILSWMEKELNFLHIHPSHSLPPPLNWTQWQAKDLVHCQDNVYLQQPQKNTTFLLCICMCTLWACVLIFGQYQRKQWQWLENFNLNLNMVKNASDLLNGDEHHEYTAIDGVRVILLMWVTLGHTFQSLMPVMSDPFYVLSSFTQHATTMLLISVQFSVDAFLMIGGLVMVPSVVRMSRRFSKFKLVLVLWLKRYWRFAPCLLFSVFFFMGVVPYISGGPFWGLISHNSIENCENSWFATVLLVSNLVNSWIDLCIPWTWYLAVDFQMFCLCVPLVLLLVDYDHDNDHDDSGKTNLKSIIGWILWGLLLFASTICTLFVVLDQSISINVLEFSSGSQFAARYYSEIIDFIQHRGRSYLIGVAYGVVIYKQKQKQSRWVPNSLLNIVLVLLSFAITTTCVFLPFTDYVQGYSTWSVMDTAAFLSFSNTLFTIAAGYIVLSCILKFRSSFLIRRFLEWNIFRVPAKLSFCYYLIHPALCGMVFYSFESLFYVRMTNLLFFSVCIFAVSLVLAFVMHISIEKPFLSLFLFKGKQ